MFIRRACNITLGFFALFLFCVNVKATNPCSGSQFWVVATDGTHSCVECEGCPPGQGLSHECGNRVSADAMVKCVPCQPGASFSSEHDTSSCVPCASCSEDQVVLQKCTPTMNVKCARWCYSKDSRRCSCLWHESSDEAEMGIQFCQYAVNDPKPSVVQSSQGVVDKRETVRDKVLATESCQPLSSEESAVRCKENASTTSTTTGQHKQHKNNKKDSKLLSSLLEHECIQQRICEVLDTPVPGRGHFKTVAQHYGFDHYQIESVLKKFDGGPSGALIESIAASHPELTVQEFPDVVTNRSKNNKQERCS